MCTCLHRRLQPTPQTPRPRLRRHFRLQTVLEVKASKYFLLHYLRPAQGYPWRLVLEDALADRIVPHPRLLHLVLDHADYLDRSRRRLVEATVNLISRVALTSSLMANRLLLGVGRRMTTIVTNTTR